MTSKGPIQLTSKIRFLFISTRTISKIESTKIIIKPQFCPALQINADNSGSAKSVAQASPRTESSKAED